jgi:hypothetical protein
MRDPFLDVTRVRCSDAAATTKFDPDGPVGRYAGGEQRGLRFFSVCGLFAPWWIALAFSMAPANANAQAYTFTTLAGAAAGHRDGLRHEARFDSPVAVATDHGNVYVVDSSNSTIRKIAPDGLTSTLAGGTRGNRDASAEGATVSTIRLKAPAQSDVSPHLSVAITGRLDFPLDSRVPIPNSGSFTLTISNAGVVATSGRVSVRAALSANLQQLTMGGAGWDCDVAGLICSRTDSLLPTAFYPDIVVTTLELGGGTFTGTAAVFGGGTSNPAKSVASLILNVISPYGCDPLVPSGGAARLGVSQTQSGNLIRGQREASYLLIQIGNSGPGLTSGSLTVTDQLPPGLTATAISGDGWNCDLAALSCTRHDVLAAFNGCTLPVYPPITIAVDVAPTAPDTVVNLVSLSGGGSEEVNGSSTMLTISNPSGRRRASR